MIKIGFNFKYIYTYALIHVLHAGWSNKRPMLQLKFSLSPAHPIINKTQSMLSLSLSLSLSHIVSPFSNHISSFSPQTKSIFVDHITSTRKKRTLKPRWTMR